MEIGPLTVCRVALLKGGGERLQKSDEIFLTAHLFVNLIKVSIYVEYEFV